MHVFTIDIPSQFGFDKCSLTKQETQRIKIWFCVSLPNTALIYK